MRSLPTIATVVSLAAVSAFAQNAPANHEEWAKQLFDHLNKYKMLHYSYRHDALVVIQFVIDRSGDLVYAKIAKSSGDAVIDSAALATVRHARPLPAPPPSVTDEQLHITVPIRFPATDIPNLR